MNSRERVLLAINHEEADRLPMFRPNMIQTYEPLDEKVQNFLENRDFVSLCRCRLRQFAIGHGIDPAAGAGDDWVMVDNEDAVFGPADIEFDAIGTAFDGRSEGLDGIFMSGCLFPRVPGSPVGENGRARPVMNTMEVQHDCMVRYRG